VEQQVAALLGPKTEEDIAAAAAPKKKVPRSSWPALSLVWPTAIAYLVHNTTFEGAEPVWESVCNSKQA
jgi:hypothetical protein